MIFNPKEEKRYIFKTLPEKASARVAINSFMIGSLFFILTLIWTLRPEEIKPIVLGQLMLAVPLLFVSSLAYAKIGYWKETKLWDTYGWFTNNTGTIFVLNALGLMVATIYTNIALCYFILFILLMLIYSIINVVYSRKSIWEKVFKFLFLCALVFGGGIIPLLLMQ